jgi:cytochrome c oxidase cbb3-type subunit 3
MCSVFNWPRLVLLSALSLLLFNVSACTGPAIETPAQGATPPIGIPVGPIPGPPLASPVMTNPYGQQAVALSEGRQLFESYNCAGCHGDHAGGGMGPSLRDEDWLYGGSDMQIYNSVAEGRGNGMPAWGTKIPDFQIWKLVGYIRSLRTDREPERPE